MGVPAPVDAFGHALLILRAMKAGVVTFEAREEDNLACIKVGGQAFDVGLYTSDGSCLSNKAVAAIVDAMGGPATFI